MSKQITMQQAREYLDLGVMEGAVILREPMGSGWHISMDGKAGGVWTLGTARGELRVFASLDSAANALRDIGWRVTSFEVGRGD
uniref:Uncharacterized protein n=1 Tax=uncultured prokaryote TaxID=198431 RepID=A0A0H5Q0E2_9ZZZZ|nr:hypothetical protein [uncultured prokaryote]